MDKHIRDDSAPRLGFWLYLMTDVMLFASFFATFMILRNATNGAGTGKELFDLPFVLLETIILLASSVAVGIAAAALKFNKTTWFVVGMGTTLLLGAMFLALEIKEFAAFVNEGNAWTESAFLSAFFTLVGAHGLHILVGLLWGSSLLWVFLKKRTYDIKSKMVLFSLFWHFLDIVWIFIFTVVYIFGAKL